MVNTIPVITVDGPSGTGKGTVSHLLARELQWHLLDSGALYRVLALAAHQHHVPNTNVAALEKLAANLDVQFVAASLGESPQIILEGSNVSEEIRDSACGNAASVVATIPEVRIALLERQRAFREPPGLVADGRDMGSTIFPEAGLKIFLIATAEQRAQRRYLQLQAQNINVSLDRVLSELIERDKRDMERSASPLKPAIDAWFLDTSTLTVDQVLMCIMEKVCEQFKDK